MVKKKLMDQEENNNKKQHESTDNKDYNPPQNTEFNDQDESGYDEGFSNSQPDKINKKSRGHDKDNHDQNQTVEKLAEMQDKYMRLSAEFDNYRKRTLREKMELSKYAGEEVLLKIIPLMDDFDRARSHMDVASDCVAMKNGIDLIYIKFSEFLKQNGIKEIESLNSDFNVDLHEAIAKVPVEEDDKKGKVVDVVLKGYYLNDKVLRFSKVVVGE